MPRRTRSRMERRTKPVEPQPLLDLTPEPQYRPLFEPQVRGLGHPPQRRYITTEDIDSAQSRRRQEAAERQQAAADQGGLDWSVCIVPGCGEEPPSYLKPMVAKVDEHNPDVWLPVCKTHGSTIWRTMNEVWKDPDIQAEMKAANTRYNAAVRNRQQRIAEQAGPGHIYCLRQNGLIKVGWASHLESRLKQYGPNVELLVHFEGSRDDETTLHRRLRPSLAQGREWYHDDEALARFVAKSVEEHGPPTLEAWWSTPKTPPVTRRWVD